MPSPKDNGAGRHIYKLPRRPVMAQTQLHHGLEPDFGFILPLHLGSGGVVDRKNTAVTKQDAGRAGAADHGRLRTRLLHLTGAVVSRPYVKVGIFWFRLKDSRLFPGEGQKARIICCDQHLGHPVQAQAVWDRVFGCAGDGIAGEEG